VDWLRELAPEELERLQRASSRCDHERGATIFAPADHPHELYLLERGLVRIYRLSSHGAEMTFGYVAPGEVFGELTAFGDFPRESYAAAVHPSRVWKIPVPVFQRMLEERPAVMLEVTRQIGQRMKRIESRVERLVFRDVRARVVGILLELSEDFGVRRGDAIALDIDLTQSELATLVGSTRQTINTSLGELEHAGLIERNGRRLILLKPNELARAARAHGEPR
jgi:CRP-like cAMP-binding protein